MRVIKLLEFRDFGVDAVIVGLLLLLWYIEIMA